MQKNPRYAHFKQHYLTAGDQDQFTQFAKAEDYIDSVNDTFKYIFHKFKKGVFVHIKDNSIFKFVPFCKANFINECADRMHVEEGSTFKNLFDQVEEHTENKLDIKYNIIYGWWHNNGLFRYEVPKIEVDPGLEYIYKFLQSLCDTKRVKDCIFFINKRDFPIKTDAHVEPYECIWGENQPLISHVYPEYCPIFSMTTRRHYSDIPMPTWDDCKRITLPQATSETLWEAKLPIAVFRGTSTGLGTTYRNNARLGALKLFKENPTLLDVGITRWNTRPRKIMSGGNNQRARGSNPSGYYKTISKKIIDMYPIKDFKSYEQQAEYKYILNLPGHTTSFRLSTLLGLNSVILHVSHRYHMWYEPLMKPYIHYVPVRTDLKDLITQIQWCIANDAACKKIVENAKVFYNKYLSKSGMTEYMISKLNELDNGQLYHPNESYTPPVMPQFHFDNPTLETVFLSQVGKNKTFYTIDTIEDKYLLKPVNHNECDMWFNYLSKLSFTYGFREIYGVYKNHNVMQFVHGQSLYDFLQTHRDFSIVVECLLQTCIILENAYYTCNFIHNDCVPWNVMVTLNERPSKLVLGNGDKTFIFEASMCTVTLIDYEKSKISRNKKECRDVFNLVIHTLFSILLNKETWSQYTVTICTRLFHQIFPEHPAYKMTSIQDMLAILSLFKKYDNMTSTRLENINKTVKLYEPMFLFNMIQKTCNCTHLNIVDFPNISSLHKLYKSSN
jgi:hypothetical protein